MRVFSAGTASGGADTDADDEGEEEVVVLLKGKKVVLNF